MMMKASFSKFRYGLCCCATLVFMTGLCAQVQPRIQDPPEAGKVTSTYDKDKDETTVEFSQLQLPGNETQRVLLSVSASYQGQKPKPPDDIIVIVSVLSKGSYRYPDVMRMQVMLEGNKVSDVVMLNLDKRKAGEDYLETIGTRMKYDLFKRVIKASSVELALENLRLPLGDGELAKLREVDALLHAND